jgi:hypothetical protein
MEIPGERISDYTFASDDNYIFLFILYRNNLDYEISTFKIFRSSDGITWDLVSNMPGILHNFLADTIVISANTGGAIVAATIYYGYDISGVQTFYYSNDYGATWNTGLTNFWTHINGTAAPTTNFQESIGGTTTHIDNPIWPFEPQEDKEGYIDNNTITHNPCGSWKKEEV